QSALRQYAISLYARRALHLLRVRAHSGLFTVRAESHRHTRKCAAHARRRHPGAPPARYLLHHVSSDRGHRRCAVGADQRLRQSQRARSRSLRDRPHRSHRRRLWAALRRLHRRRSLYGARAFPGPNLSDRVATRSRASAGRDCDVRAQRHPRPRRGAAAALCDLAHRAMSAARLETRALCRHFGALHAVSDINFKLDAGARHALIGPNGAGKTTFVNLLTGVLPPTRGSVLLAGRDITERTQAERVKLGIARTFQISRLFRGLSVLENVSIPVAERVGAASSMLYPAGRRTDVIEEAMHLLDTLKLADHAHRRVSELPYGRQRVIELALDLGMKPQVLLLDEPAAGVPSAESHIILDAIERLPE